jgi:hypothetical protein
MAMASVMSSANAMKHRITKLMVVKVASFGQGAGEMLEEIDVADAGHRGDFFQGGYRQRR